MPHEDLLRRFSNTSGSHPFSRRDMLGVTAAGAASLMLDTRTSAEEPKMPEIIDPHVHVWKNDPRYPWPAELKEPPAQDALPGPLLELMDANGVSKTVVVHVIYYRWDCRYAADVVKAHPGRFMGVCRVDPMSPTAPDDLSAWVRNSGFHGVRLSPVEGADGDWINHRPQMDRIWKRTAALQVPMCILCPVSRLDDVGKVIERHPNVDVCIDHMAECPIDQPPALKKLLALARYPRVYVKISHLWRLSQEKYPYFDTHDQVKQLYDAFGPQRLMWGSDWPAVEDFCGYAKSLALYSQEIKFFNNDDRRWILGGTALKLWPFTKNSSHLAPP